MTASPGASTDDPLGWLDAELAALDGEHLRRDRQTVIPRANGRCEIGGRELINFATNDYLGLAHHPWVVESARQALDECGCGARASALMSGRTHWHERLETRIAEFEGTEAALLFPTGYAANVGTITALVGRGDVGRGDVVIGDRLNHGSLVDGCRLSGATFRVYPHRDAERVDHELRKHGRARRKLIVTDGVFSMDGDIAPLADLCDVADRHGAMLLVDEAHGTGVLGPKGRGAAEHAGVEDRVPIRVGTLSKALGSQGGFVAGSQRLIDWLANRARSQMYSTALNPAACGAAIGALDVLREEPDRIGGGWRSRIRDQLSDVNIPWEGARCVPIIPLIVDSPATALSHFTALIARGIFVPAVRPPSVPRGTSRLRISLSFDHTREDINRLLEALFEIWPGHYAAEVSED